MTLCQRLCCTCMWRGVIEMWLLYPMNYWLMEETDILITNHQYTLFWVQWWRYEESAGGVQRGRIQGVFTDDVTFELVIKGGVRILQVEKGDKNSSGRGNSSNKGKMMWKSMTNLVGLEWGMHGARSSNWWSSIINNHLRVKEALWWCIYIQLKSP